MKPGFKISYALLAAGFLSACTRAGAPPYSSWEVYGGSDLNLHYSSLVQIDTSSVTRLKPAWVYHTGDADSMTQIEVNPIVANDILYGVSPKLKLFALDAATGREKWVFNPFDSTDDTGQRKFNFAMNVCRGVTYYEDDSSRYIFYAAGSYLYCLDALTGKPVKNFGNNGWIDLHQDLGEHAKDLYVAMTSPGIIYKDMIIIGSRVSEEAAAAPGYIRAYDVHTGRLRWIFYTIPPPGQPGYSSWEDTQAYAHIGGVNAWSGFSLDRKRGILFAPTGSASYDFYGGRRLGNDLFANCLLAIDAATGKLIWYFQTVHHDVWDRDLPSPPALITITKDGRRTDAVAQATKTGFVFVLDRETGHPLYPVEEKPVPVQSELAGEKLSTTQPFPLAPKPFVRQTLTSADLNTLEPDSSYRDIQKRLAGYKTGVMFNPPSKEGTVILPGFDGGSEWGGPSYDPQTGILYVNANEMAWVLTMVDIKNNKAAASAQTNLSAGKRLYAVHCMACHGTNRQGGGNYPSLNEAGKKYNEAAFMQLISSGRRMMPAFKQLNTAEKTALASFILDLRKLQQQQFTVSALPKDPYWELPYSSTGYNKFLTKEGYPAIAPPWGTLSAIDLNTGRYCWKDTLGDYPGFKAKGIHTGTENYGGSVVTAGGLLFIAATRDGKLRAYNKRTGQLLWETGLPAPGFATPAVYEVKGKEYLVIACGGGKLGTKSGDAYMGFALPQ